MQTERLDHAATEAKAKRMTGDDLAFAMKDAQEASEAAQEMDAAGRHAPKLDWYADEVLIYGAEIARRERAAGIERAKRTGRPMGPAARKAAAKDDALKAAKAALESYERAVDSGIGSDPELWATAKTQATEALAKIAKIAKLL